MNGRGLFRESPKKCILAIQQCHHTEVQLRPAEPLESPLWTAVDDAQGEGMTSN